MKGLRLDGIEPGPLAVSTEGLGKRYGRATALAGVSLRVPEGAVYVLVGPNGAGKSTLIRILMHLVRGDAGRVEVLGVDVRRSGADARARIGYVPESYELGYPWLTVGRLLAHHAVFHPGWDREYADRMVRMMDIRLDRRCGALSKGQGRRVQLVIALAYRPPLLLLDEPSDGLDHVARDRTLTLLTEHLADSPTTMLISTHRVHEFERLVDHVGVLHDGALLGQTTASRMRHLLRRYRADVPDGWAPPAELRAAVVRRSSAGIGRQIDWTILGEQELVVAQLGGAGAMVRDVSSISLDDAAVALLGSTEAP